MIWIVNGMFYAGMVCPLSDHPPPKGHHWQSSDAKVFLLYKWKNGGPIQHILTQRLLISGHSVLDRVGEENAHSPTYIFRGPIQKPKEYLAQIDRTQLRKYNVIFLLLESLRPDQLQSFGGKRSVMPNLDILASHSTRLQRAYAQSSHSDYADPSPFSSQYPLRTLTHYYYPEKSPFPRVMIYDILKELGYKTSIISSQNEFWGGMKNYLDTGNLDLFFHSESRRDVAQFPTSDIGFMDWVRKYGILAGKLDDQITIDSAIKWIGEVKDAPFFSYINLQSSHSPYPLPEKFKRKFGPDKLDFTLIFGNYPPEKVEVVKNLYADSLNYMDIQIGRLFKYLKKEKLWENTIIVAMGDNGNAFYEHGFADHAADLYDEAVRTPIILKIPGTNPSTENMLVQHIDIAPSILAKMGLPPFVGFQGRNIFDPTSERKTALFIVAQTARKEQYGIVYGQYKLLFSPQDEEILLFDLHADPEEKTNISEHMPHIKQILAKKLKNWITAQLEYYNNPIRMKIEFPPKIIE